MFILFTYLIHLIFRYSTDLRDYFHVHLKRHHVAGSEEVRQFPCPLCRFATDQIMGLTTHLNKHQVRYNLSTYHRVTHWLS